MEVLSPCSGQVTLLDADFSHRSGPGYSRYSSSNFGSLPCISFGALYTQDLATWSYLLIILFISDWRQPLHTQLTRNDDEPFTPCCRRQMQRYDTLPGFQEVKCSGCHLWQRQEKRRLLAELQRFDLEQVWDRQEHLRVSPMLLMFLVGKTAPPWISWFFKVWYRYRNRHIVAGSQTIPYVWKGNLSAFCRSALNLSPPSGIEMRETCCSQRVCIALYVSLRIPIED